MKNQWCKDSFDEYKKVDAFNSSSVKLILRSPAHYKALKDAPSDTDATKLGSLIHMAILEPDRLDSDVIIEPAYDRRTNKYKEELAKLLAHVDGAPMVISQNEWQMAQEIKKKISEHPLAHDFISSGHKERSGYIHDEEFNLDIKFRPDVYHNNFIVDIKTTKNASFASFQKDIFNYGYDIQAAFYLFYSMNLAQKLGEEPPQGFIWIAVEKDPPYEIGIYSAGENIIKIGGAKCQQALNVFYRCRENNKWPGYPDEIIEMSPPSWIKE